MMLSTSIVSIFAATGCATAGPDDALSGTWSNSSCFGSATMPADIQTCSTTLAFGTDLSLKLTDTRQSQPATAMYPRCTTTRVVSGQTYSTSNGTGIVMAVTVAGSGSSTVERSGCVNSTDNAASMADTVDSIPNGAMTYEFGANTLTISSGPLAGRYTRVSH